MRDDGPAKTRQILDAIRSRIVSGQFLPGQRLPTFADMQAEFGAGRAVLQNVVESLKADGFICSVNRQGLFVVDSPPHLHRYGLALSAEPGQAGWCRLTAALATEARRVEQRDPFARFCFYFRLQEKDAWQESAQLLREDVRASRLAGLILTPKTFELLQTPELCDLDVPAVEIWSPSSSDPRVTRVNTDTTSLLRRALDHLKKAGRQRIAVLHMADTTSEIDHARLFADTGLTLHAPWLQRIGRSHPQFAQDIMPLLMDYPTEARPDGLIIADDSLTEPAMRGLHGAGLRVGRDLDVVAHANWPGGGDVVEPRVTRIGFDMREILRRAIESIQMRSRGETPPALATIPALFEWEVDHSSGEAPPTA